MCEGELGRVGLGGFGGAEDEVAEEVVGDGDDDEDEDDDDDDDGPEAGAGA